MIFLNMSLLKWDAIVNFVYDKDIYTILHVYCVLFPILAKE